MKKNNINKEITKIKLMMESVNKNNFQLLELAINKNELEEKTGDTIVRDILHGGKDWSSIERASLGTAFKDMENAIGLYNNPIKLGGKELKTAEDIFNAIKDGSLQGKELGRVEKGLLKSTKTDPSLRRSIILDFISDKSVLNDISKNCKNTSDIKNYLKGKGYADDSINEIISQLKGKKLIDNKGLFTYKSNIKNTTVAGGSTIKKYTFEQLSKLKNYLLGGKRTWGNILKWGAGIGLTGFTLWWMLKDSGKKPDDMPPTPPTPTPDTTDDDQPKKTTYHNCYDKDINVEDIEFGCRSNTVKEIQICLGFEKKYQTGNFGPITMKAIGGNVITKEVYDQIMSKCKGPEPVTGTTTADGVPSETQPTTNNEPTIAPEKLEKPGDVLAMRGGPEKTPEEKSKQISDGESLFKQLRDNYPDRVKPFIKKRRNSLVYKGPLLKTQEELNALNTYIESLGYKFRKVAEKDREDYDEKYVWDEKKQPKQISEEKIKNIVSKHLYSHL